MTKRTTPKAGKKMQLPRKKDLNMEEKSTTMPDVMYLKYLHFNHAGPSPQGRIYHAAYQEDREQISCPHCKSNKCYRHGYYKRRVTLANKEATVRRVCLKVARYRCRCCGRTFVVGCEKIGLGKYQRRNKLCNKLIVRASQDGETNKSIAAKFGVCESTVEKQLHDSCERLIREQINYPLPRVLGIDEHKIHKGGKYAVTLMDLAHHRVYEVIETKSREVLEHYLRSKEGCEKVEVVCMDMCTMFRGVMTRLTPRAKIVADRFHVIRLVNKALQDYVKEVKPELRRKRGCTRLLGMHPSKLSKKQKEELTEILTMHSTFKPAYDFSVKLTKLLNLKTLTKKACRKPLRRLKMMIDALRYTSHHIWRTPAKTLSEWFEPIIRMWRFSRSNGITEGFRRKMKLIRRRAYGYRNFANYRLRVLPECGHLFTSKSKFYPMLD